MKKVYYQLTGTACGRMSKLHNQFDGLEQQINALAAQANAMTQVQAIYPLATQVSGLAETICS